MADPAVNPMRGVVTAMATAFAPDGELDLAASARLARHLVERGSTGLVLAGTTGESPTLDDREKLALLGAVRDELGTDVPLALGTGSNDTMHSAELTAAAAEAGADAGLVVTPYYNRPNPEGVRAHFETVAAAAPELPIIVYNIPSRVVVNVPPEQLAELARIPNVTAVKQANDEDVGPVEGLDLLAGNDTNLVACLDAGGVGGILVASHFVGEEMARIIELHAAGDRTGAVAIDGELAPVYEAMAVTTNPIPVKAALAMAGLCPPTMRLPMVEASDEEKGHIRSLLAEGGVELP